MTNIAKHDNEKTLTTNRPETEGQRLPERVITPRASVYETPDSVMLELEMPGVSRDSIEVSVENDELSVSGRRVYPADDGVEWLHQERLPFNYRRSFILSDRIESTNIGAEYTDGVLRLTLPKAVQAKPRKITIE